MPKTTVTPLQLAEKYLIKIGLNPFDVKRALLPSLFDDNTICKPLTPQDILPNNKKLDKFTQTHIYINKGFWPELYTATQVNAYKTTGNSQKAKQDLVVFEGNVSALLTRRSTKLSPSVVSYKPTQSYTPASSVLLSSLTYKKFFYQSGVQVHIGIEDGDTFKDFRHGILEKDYLILFKYANKNCLLAIAIPSEFCSKYNVSGTSKISRRTYTPSTAQRKAYFSADADYSSEANDSSVKTEITSLAPLPAPSGSSRGSSNKPKYRGNPARGKGAISKAGFKCEWDNSHSTFISKTTGQDYMEPHHLIPISKQNLYPNDIDITSNLICLCPNCHKRIHLGQKSDIEMMLRKFHTARQSDLLTCGIDIDIYTLLAYYEI